jgi:hypothetical protein
VLVWNGSIILKGESRSRNHLDSWSGSTSGAEVRQGVWNNYISLPSEPHILALGLEKKLELDELARARSSSARLGPARRSERARAEPVFVAREKSEPARLGSVQLASWLVARFNNNLLHKILISI